MPDKIVDIPNVGTVSFPDSMKDEDINKAIRQHLSAKANEKPIQPSYGRAILGAMGGPVGMVAAQPKLASDSLPLLGGMFAGAPGAGLGSVASSELKNEFPSIFGERSSPLGVIGNAATDATLNSPLAANLLSKVGSKAMSLFPSVGKVLKGANLNDLTQKVLSTFKGSEPSLMEGLGDATRLKESGLGFGQTPNEGLSNAAPMSRKITLDPDIAKSLQPGTIRIGPDGKQQILQKVPIHNIAGDEGNTIYEDVVKGYQAKGKGNNLQPELKDNPNGGYTIQEGHHRILADVRNGANEVTAWVPHTPLETPSGLGSLGKDISNIPNPQLKVSETLLGKTSDKIFSDITNVRNAKLVSGRPDLVSQLGTTKVLKAGFDGTSLDPSKILKTLDSDVYREAINPEVYKQLTGFLQDIEKLAPKEGSNTFLTYAKHRLAFAIPSALVGAATGHTVAGIGVASVILGEKALGVLAAKPAILSALREGLKTNVNSPASGVLAKTVLNAMRGLDVIVHTASGDKKAKIDNEGNLQIEP